MFGVNRIRIAQPILDLGDRETFRPRRARRLGRGLRRRRDALGPVQFPRPGQITTAASAARRWMKRDGIAGAPPIFAARLSTTSGALTSWAKS